MCVWVIGQAQAGVFSSAALLLGPRRRPARDAHRWHRLCSQQQVQLHLAAKKHFSTAYEAGTLVAEINKTHILQFPLLEYS